MSLLIIVLVAFAYAGILWQLVGTPIPSEASSYQLLLSSNQETRSERIAKESSRPAGVKTLLYALPIIAGLSVLILPGLSLATNFSFLGIWMIAALSTEPIRLFGSILAFAGSLYSTLRPTALSCTTARSSVYL